MRVRRNSAGEVPGQLVIDRVLMTGLLTAVPTGLVALGVAQAWAPLVYLFWVMWPALFVAVWVRLDVAIARCPDCLGRMAVGAVRCPHCCHSFEE